jgi:hypothetical protein
MPTAGKKRSSDAMQRPAGRRESLTLAHGIELATCD